MNQRKNIRKTIISYLFYKNDDYGTYKGFTEEAGNKLR